MELLKNTTRNLFFTGKGGVGKTSIACATAIALADAGKRVLLVSTDPASNLDEVLGVALNQKPTAIPGVPGLSALNIDPEAAAHDYRERMVGPYRGILRMRRSIAWKNSCPARARLKSLLSMNLPSSWVIQKRPRRLIMLSSIPRQRVIRYDC